MEQAAAAGGINSVRVQKIKMRKILLAHKMRNSRESAFVLVRDPQAISDGSGEHGEAASESFQKTTHNHDEYLEAVMSYKGSVLTGRYIHSQWLQQRLQPIMAAG
ncbi:hypothetical protein EYF80_022466 [Liparis tanakae]|uniref:Uncharacterized protein n=1 Tax=Liparis tanakae TaxID=230148 RepID=A0A4Z2HNF4_9TELE|nr:hypothetical protein EYF80_022466 [Liparis tanakae]